MIDVSTITAMHEATVRGWHQREIENSYEGLLAAATGREIENSYEGFLELACRQHEQNYRLWHEEDIARSRDVADADLAQVKRRIDRLNQQRNDLIEQLDDYLIGELARAGVQPASDARLNTETPGSAIDRLSILALRIYHMREQAARSEAGEAHCAKARARLDILGDQHRDISQSLAELLADIFSGRKRLKVYRQFKMYNDPAMNPYLYQARERPAA